MSRRNKHSNREKMQFRYMFVHWKKERTKKKFFSIFILVFSVAGFILQYYYSFPYLFQYVCIFYGIGIILIRTIHKFSLYMPEIISQISHQKAAQSANSFYYVYVRKNPLYIVCPSVTVFIFGYGGCTMFGALSINMLFIWIMILFSIIVFISIYGYIQYIFLAIYIHKVATSNYELIGLKHSLQECVPADIDWIQKLTKICHIYRTAFFSIGSLYIIAFSAFCYLPGFNANCNSLAYFVLWAIIFVAIVLFFPIVSFFEYIWIKKIVEKIKNAYILDIKKESSQLEKSSAVSPPSKIQLLFFENMYAFKIMESRAYPITSFWAMGYSVALAVFNFLSAMITVIQGAPIILTVLRQIP